MPFLGQPAAFSCEHARFDVFVFHVVLAPGGVFPGIGPGAGQVDVFVMQYLLIGVIS